MKPSITYVCLAHGEEELFNLVTYLKNYKDEDDKIVILQDPTTDEYTKRLRATGYYVINHYLNKDYSTHRNIAVDKCKTDYWYQIDADEQPAKLFIKNIKHILIKQNLPDAVWQPRKNLFKGVLPIHALEMGFHLQDGVVSWPDPQCRLIKNRQGIRFVGKLHERVRTSKHHNVLHLPFDFSVCIEHYKTMQKQISDDLNYNQNYSVEENTGETTRKELIYASPKI